MNLLSASKITEKGYTVVFSKNDAQIYDNRGKILVKANKENNLYYLEESTSVASEIKLSDLELWHRRFGHLNVKDLKSLKTKYKVFGLQFKSYDMSDCETCLKSKMTQLPYHRSERRSTKLLEIIHSDICGAFRCPSLGDNRYLIIFIDD